MPPRPGTAGAQRTLNSLDLFLKDVTMVANAVQRVAAAAAKMHTEDAAKHPVTTAAKSAASAAAAGHEWRRRLRSVREGDRTSPEALAAKSGLILENGVVLARLLWEKKMATEGFASFSRDG